MNVGNMDRRIQLQAATLTANATIMVGGGLESISLVQNEKMRTDHLADAWIKEHKPALYMTMLETAETVAERYGITREAQDVLGALSHARARQAIGDGLFDEEIVPLVLKSRRGDQVFKVDERPMDTTVEKMGQLRPVFKKDGTVTAGNASGINDAAAAVLLMDSEKARELGLEPMAQIKAFASGGLDPAFMGLGPVPAVRKVLHSQKMQIDDIDMIELNEAFAAQAIACCRELKVPEERPNELGSGISIGHPIGCTGARQMVTAIHQMQRKNYASGLISMCIGGGMGMAMLIGK